MVPMGGIGPPTQEYPAVATNGDIDLATLWTRGLIVHWSDGYKPLNFMKMVGPGGLEPPTNGL